MGDWTDGYRGDIGYSFSYFNELNPARIKLVLLSQGFDCPDIKTACELGFGQGVSINIHSAGSNIEWHGNDFIPEQAVFARKLAEFSGANTHLYDDSFDEFQLRADLPKFDFIALHGVWSWISESNRETIVEIVRDRLNVGGILYVSYNTHPGWSTFAPLRQLMAQHTQVMGAKGSGVLNRIDDSISFTSDFLKCKPKFAMLNNVVSNKFEDIRKENRHYLAHEYFNADWHISYFADVAEKLSEIKLNYACSAHLLDHIDSVNFTADQREFLQKISDPILKESTRDLIVNQGFRRDLWVKGAQRLSALEKFEKLRDTRLVLVIPRSEAKLHIKGPAGEISLKESFYAPILDFLADYQIRRIGEMIENLQQPDLTPSTIIESALILVASGYLAVAQEEEEINSTLATTKNLNAALLNRARSFSDIDRLSSPVTGGGVKVNRFQQLFILAMQAGHQDTENWVQFAWNILSGQGQKIIKDGKNLESEEDNLRELDEQAKGFQAVWLPVLQALKAV